ncbi:MAG: cysteine desulfurase [Clostridiales bacterium]|nr:cysteine desulfurase [Candidatus Equinaster intestinalis]
MENTVYFDNSATTKPCATAIKYINEALTVNWGNPSSLHTLGISAEDELNKTRECVASLLSCRSDEIFFTSGGTESNNLAILGAALSRKKRGNRIVTTAVEHPSVLQTVKLLEEFGFEVIRLHTNLSGKVSEDDIKSAIDKNTILVSIMLVNNETGAVQPIKTAADAIKESSAPALLHCDAVQAFGKLSINPAKLGIDLLSASGHKIHASKGVGILYKKKGVNIKTLIGGGGQEKGLRSGTEGVVQIAGLRGAIEEIGNIEENFKKISTLNSYAREKLLKSGLIKINSPADALPYLLNISVLGYRSETLLHFLDSKGIFVSSGSACAKGEKSYVLTELGLSAKEIDSALRISFSRFNKTEEIDILCKALEQACNTIRKA